jgi:hypothetical protein
MTTVLGVCVRRTLRRNPVGRLPLRHPSLACARTPLLGKLRVAGHPGASPSDIEHNLRRRVSPVARRGGVLVRSLAKGDCPVFRSPAGELRCTSPQGRRGKW